MAAPIAKKEHTPPEKTGEKERKPKRSFKAVMDRPPPPETFKGSIFDLAKRASSPSSRKKTVKKNGPPKQLLPQVEQTQTRLETPTVCENREISSVSKLSPAMQELLNQMEDYVFMKSQEGVATVELQIDLKDAYAPFQGTVIRIDHYSTDPHGFNLTLISPNQSAINALTTHLQDLSQALQAKLPYFHINFLPPAFPKLEETKATRKVSKTFRGEKKEERKTREIKKKPFLN